MCILILVYLIENWWSILTKQKVHDSSSVLGIYGHHLFIKDDLFIRAHFSFLSTFCTQGWIFLLNIISQWFEKYPPLWTYILSFHLLRDRSPYNTVALFFSLLTLKSAELRKVVLFKSAWQGFEEEYLHQVQRKCATRIYRLIRDILSWHSTWESWRRKILDHKILDWKKLLESRVGRSALSQLKVVQSHK